MEFCNRPLSWLKVNGATVLPTTKQDTTGSALATKAKPLSAGDAEITAWALAYSKATVAERKRILAVWNAEPEHRP
jgi:hypothetical protein